MRKEIQKNTSAEGRERSFEDVIIGKNAVREALSSGRAADRLLIERGEHKSSLSPIVAICRERGIPVKEVDGRKLDFLSGQGNHQGVILMAAAHEYVTLEELFAAAEEKGEPPFFILCDSLEDPHNLGAIIRSAEAAGAHGIVVTRNRSVGLNATVGKSSAGALEYLKVARVTNMTDAIREMKKRGMWIYAADMDGKPYYETEFSGGVGLIIGSEGNGVGRLVKENADVVVSIPMQGRINSLNASVAAGILMFEISKQRNTKG